MLATNPPQRKPVTSRWQVAERRRLLNLAARIGRRRQWWIAQRDATAARVDAITAQLAATEAALAALDRAEAQR